MLYMKHDSLWAVVLFSCNSRCEMIKCTHAESLVCVESRGHEMEYLVLAAALGIGLLLIFLKNVSDQRKLEQSRKVQFAKEFGQFSKKAEDTERATAVSGYFRHHQDGFFIDDITYNDLELDRLFGKMDTTVSSAGQEYLYHLLRTPSFSEQELVDREAKISFWTAEEKLRIQLQMIFWKLGKTRKYSIYDYLDFLDNLGERDNGRHFCCCALFAVSLLVLMLYPNPAAGVVLLCLTCVYNIMVYLKEKKQIEPYLVCFGYVFRALAAAEKIRALTALKDSAAFGKEVQELEELGAEFGALKRKGILGMRVMGGNGNPIELVADYFNMLFHLDLISFNAMLKLLRKKSDRIDRLFFLLGEMEATVAAASWRQALAVSCVPELHEKKEGENPFLKTEEVWHPLIEEAVRNDIHAKKGVLLTGSNASGKSTFLKAIAVNAILAQTVHSCAAASWQGNLWRVMSSMALRDDMASSESYYIVEIKALKRILDAVDMGPEPVLCFVDEVLRGTNTVERIAASVEILRSLDREDVLCFAATHDIELTELLEKIYDNYHFCEQVEKGDVYFSYQLMQGPARSRNAIRLLSLMGYDESIIRQAEMLAAGFLESGSWKESNF